MISCLMVLLRPSEVAAFIKSMYFFSKTEVGKRISILKLKQLFCGSDVKLKIFSKIKFFVKRNYVKFCVQIDPTFINISNWSISYTFLYILNLYLFVQFK